MVSGTRIVDAELIVQFFLSVPISLPCSVVFRGAFSCQPSHVGGERGRRDRAGMYRSLGMVCRLHGLSLMLMFVSADGVLSCG